MFEDALMESGGRIRTRSKYYTFLGVLLNGFLLAALILFPLLHPEALPKNALTSMLVAPEPPAPAPLPPVETRPLRAAPQLSEFAAPRTIPRAIDVGRDDTPQPPADTGVRGMGDASGSPSELLASLGNAAPPVVTTAQPKSFTVSRGVMAGNLVEKQDPVYPAIARSAHIEGTVILSATISKTGTIENLTVVSGSPMLARAAIEAVRNWRYRPYLLNGIPVAVNTTVSVTFTLGG